MKRKCSLLKTEDKLNTKYKQIKNILLKPRATTFTSAKVANHRTVNYIIPLFETLMIKPTCGTFIYLLKINKILL